MEPHPKRNSIALYDFELAGYFQERFPTLFGGVFALNELEFSKAPFQPIIVVFNSSIRSQTYGHWSGAYIKNGICRYWDPYGLEPFGNIAKYLEKSSEIVYFNSKIVQSLNSEFCGYFVIYCLSKLAVGLSITDINKHFTIDLSKNERKVYMFYQKFCCYS